MKIPHTPSRIFGLSAVLVLMAGLTFSPVMAQERIPFSGDDPRGDHIGDARFLRSGALLIASFDANHDFLITDEEIIAGARNTFKYADADQDGSMSPLEQRAWAARITSEKDVLGNSSLFISAIPGQVSEDEFVAGLRIFSDRFRDADGNIRFVDLTFEPQRPEKGNNRPEERVPMRRPNVDEGLGGRGSSR